MMAKRLSPAEFNAARERVEPIFRHISEEVGKPDRFSAGYFFGNWNLLMEGKIANTWEVEGAVLGGLLYRDIFNGHTRASIMFWFSLPEARGTGRPIKLLDAFEGFAKDSGAKVLSGAAYTNLNPERLRKIYRKRGYELTEEIWSKCYV